MLNGFASPALPRATSPEWSRLRATFLGTCTEMPGTEFEPRSRRTSAATECSAAPTPGTEFRPRRATTASVSSASGAPAMEFRPRSRLLSNLNLGSAAMTSPRGNGQVPEWPPGGATPSEARRALFSSREEVAAVRPNGNLPAEELPRSVATPSEARRASPRFSSKESMPRSPNSRTSSKQSVMLSARAAVPKRPAPPQPRVEDLANALTSHDFAKRHEAVLRLRGLIRGCPKAAEEVGEAGVIKPLVRLLTEGKQQGEVAEAAVEVLVCIMDDHPLNQAKVAAVGGVHAMMGLLKHGGPREKKTAAQALAAMSSRRTSVRDTMIQEGAVEVLQRLRDRGTPGQRRAAAAALLPFCHARSPDDLTAAGMPANHASRD